MAEEVVVPDGAEYPFVEDLDGLWHARPADDEWTVTNDGPNANTLCGLAVWSVRVSTFAPTDEDQRRCTCCEDGGPHG